MKDKHIHPIHAYIQNAETLYSHHDSHKEPYTRQFHM